MTVTELRKPTPSNCLVEGRRCALVAPTTGPIISNLYQLHHVGRRNAFNVMPPGTLSVEQWAQTFRRGFHYDAAVVCSTGYQVRRRPGEPDIRVAEGELLGYAWTYDYAPEHGNVMLGCLFRENLRGIAHVEGLALWIDLLFEEYPLDVLGIECSDRCAEQFGAFLPRLFAFDGKRKGWLRHGAQRENLSLWSMTRETWVTSRFAQGRYFGKAGT